MDFNEAFDYDSLLHYSSFRGISQLSRRIPPFGREIVDVGYVDVTEERIMDPAYLLPENSAVPFYVEERRRAAMFRGIKELRCKLESVMMDFYRNTLHSPRGIGHCPYRWEVDYFDFILERFFDFEEKLWDGILQFESKTTTFAKWLWLDLGYDDIHHNSHIAVAEEQALRSLMRNDFLYDLMHINKSGQTLDDDLPF